jgi:hypothetical protein
MKRVFLFLILFAASAVAQNLQIHYDMGKDDNGNERKYFTTTLEMFKPDEYGATFFFVDMDYNQPGNKAVSLAYWEIARYINLGVVDGLAATIQFNDGMAPWGPLGQVWLAGLSYPVDLGFVTINTDLLYRSMYGSEGSDFQATFVWFKPFFDGKLTFSGFCDVWTQDDFNGDKKTVVLTEPQLWYNVTNHLAVGGEVEISHNFLPTEAWEMMPTVAMKWNF